MIYWGQKKWKTLENFFLMQWWACLLHHMAGPLNKSTIPPLFVNNCVFFPIMQVWALAKAYIKATSPCSNATTVWSTIMKHFRFASHEISSLFFTYTYIYFLFVKVMLQIKHPQCEGQKPTKNNYKCILKGACASRIYCNHKVIVV